MNGLAYVALRKNGAPLPLGCAGHVAWGFLQSDSSYYAGSTENESGLPIVLPGGDNGWWGADFDSETAMIAAFRERGYDCYKVAATQECNAQAARETADASQGWGYEALGNNCLDHVWRVLKAYGEAGLPWAQTHPSPNDWFAVYNGEFHNIQ